MNSKPRIIKNYDELSDTVKQLIFNYYPSGFQNHLILFKNREGKFVSALPFETEDRYYLIRMTEQKAEEIFMEDEDEYTEDDQQQGSELELELD